MEFGNIEIWNREYGNMGIWNLEIWECGMEFLVEGGGREGGRKEREQG